MGCFNSNDQHDSAIDLETLSMVSKFRFSELTTHVIVFSKTNAHEKVGVSHDQFWFDLWKLDFCCLTVNLCSVIHYFKVACGFTVGKIEIRPKKKNRSKIVCLFARKSKKERDYFLGFIHPRPAAAPLDQGTEPGGTYVVLGASSSGTMWPRTTAWVHEIVFGHPRPP